MRVRCVTLINPIRYRCSVTHRTNVNRASQFLLPWQFKRITSCPIHETSRFSSHLSRISISPNDGNASITGNRIEFNWWKLFRVCELRCFYLGIWHLSRSTRRGHKMAMINENKCVMYAWRLILRVLNILGINFSLKWYLNKKILFPIYKILIYSYF